MSQPITVAVHPDGRVIVNGVLVAEAAVGVVEGRDELAASLDVARTAEVVAGVIDKVVTSVGGLGEKDRLEFARGLSDGLGGATKQLHFLDPSKNVTTALPPGVPPDSTPVYRTGYHAGDSLRGLHRHLRRFAGEDIHGAAGALRRVAAEITTYEIRHAVTHTWTALHSLPTIDMDRCFRVWAAAEDVSDLHELGEVARRRHADGRALSDVLVRAATSLSQPDAAAA